MSKKKILVFIDWFYPAYKAGGPVQSCLNLIEKLGDEFEFKVVTSNKEYQETEPLKDIIPNSWISYPNGLIVQYLSAPSSEIIKRILDEEKPDMIWLNSMFSKNFSILPLRIWKGKTILSPRGMLAPEALKLKKTKKAIFLKLTGLLGWHKQVTFHATSTEEKNQIAQHFPLNKIHFAPNIPTPSVPLTVPKEKQKGELRLVSLARIAPEKNIRFALDLLLLFKKNFPDITSVTFDQYGSTYNETYLSQCKEVADLLLPAIKTTFNGSLPSKLVHATLQHYDFLLFPTLGENYGHAIVQAWGAGLAVLISDATPWKDLEKNNLGWDISNSDEQKWLKVLKKCLDMGPEEYQRLSAAAKAKADQLSTDPNNLVLSQNLFN